MNYQRQYTPKGYSSLPTVIKNILIINAIVFLALNLFASRIPGEYSQLIDTFALHFFSSELFRPWQLITHMFMHQDFFHFFFNMFALWMFGMVLENIWGPKKFLIFYFLTGLGAAIIYLLIAEYTEADWFAQYKVIKSMPLVSEYDILSARKIMAHVNVATLGASGAVFGILVAFGYLFPNTLLYFYFLVPIKTKWAVLAYVGYELFMAIKGFAGDNVAHTAHLGGALVGFLLVLYWDKRGKNFYR